MKQKSFLLLLLVIIGVIILSGCQPKIYGQVKRKKDRKCGCELIKPVQVDHLYTYFESN